MSELYLSVRRLDEGMIVPIIDIPMNSADEAVTERNHHGITIVFGNPEELKAHPELERFLYPHAQPVPEELEPERPNWMQKLGRG